MSNDLRLTVLRTLHALIIVAMAVGIIWAAKSDEHDRAVAAVAQAWHKCATGLGTDAPDTPPHQLYNCFNEHWWPYAQHGRVPE